MGPLTWSQLYGLSVPLVVCNISRKLVKSTGFPAVIEIPDVIASQVPPNESVLNTLVLHIATRLATTEPVLVVSKLNRPSISATAIPVPEVFKTV